ncbi:hypothetical protein SOVF_049030 [Spinacia oleracea]|uniref:Pentatricopeptide repeat-containing protein At4g32450, mitochondrial-like n=1 Tax=Spinacia oleracea TaxID=3562 RepID=A0A9R0J4Q1_SPIOL|nr:pentatricopeptide repeat-containing protein At4g32450, mitochondrial-like [Spinacia oleracea]XP_021859894.2 pentatricopeptide repeat-containing protein At4g32450, mitochondrial-like [Spinacia oleracea]KNA20813.1 hypothetical protein SOVF_049030 [Spinacia oleracea]
MNRYWPLFSKFRRFHNRHCDLHISRRNDIASCQGTNVGEIAFCGRQYSSVGVEQIPENNQDIHSDGMYEYPRNLNDLHTPGDSGLRAASVNYKQNTGHFQHHSSPTSHYVTNEWTSPQNLGHHRVDTTAFQQTSNHQTLSTGQYQQSPSNMYMENGVKNPTGNYQQQHVDGRSSWNSHHQPDAGGYRNTNLGPHQQNFNGSHHPVTPNTLPQPQASAAPHNIGNGVANPPGSYQQEHMDSSSSWNSHHQANPGGYRNTNLGPHQRNFNGSHSPMTPDTLPQPQVNTTPHNMGNGVANPTGNNQEERVDSRSSWNANHQTNAGGYRNTNLGPHQQNFNGSHSPKTPSTLPQPQVSATPHWQSVESDEFDDVEGTLEELDVFCEDWDLEHAVKSMRKLSKKGVYIDMPRYLILIDACGKAKALKEAQDVHQNLIKFASPVKVSIFNKILEMYGKCGSMDDAYYTFNNMSERNLTSWDTMITWYAKNGLGEDAIDMFTKFKEAGLKPDGQIFLGIFDACGVLNDVTEGLLHFDSMTKIHSITPTMDHYASIVHMFGSAGDLEGALEFIEKMPVEPSVSVWESLMNIARVQGNIEMGDRCAEIVKQLDPDRLSKELKDGLLPVNVSDTPKKKVKKHNPLAQTKHEYRAGDRSHPENDKIYTVLRGIKESVKEAGYVAETKFVLHDIDHEGKEEAIMAHSERLACTYALLTNPARMPLRIIKNLRVCGDCHNYFKIISKLVGREVIMRDAKRFHHFKDGKCSCNDYW